MHCTIKTCRRAGGDSCIHHVEICVTLSRYETALKNRRCPKQVDWLMTGCAFRWGSAHCHKEREVKKHRRGGKERGKKKQVNNRCDRMNWKIWKKAKWENANDCVGEQQRSGDGVFAVIKMTMLGGWGGGWGRLWRHFIFHEWDILSLVIPLKLYTQAANFQF